MSIPNVLVSEAAACSRGKQPLKHWPAKSLATAREAGKHDSNTVILIQTNASHPRKLADAGAGGRITDALVSAASPYAATSFSLAGSAIFAQGLVTNRRRRPGCCYCHFT